MILRVGTKIGMFQKKVILQLVFRHKKKLLSTSKCLNSEVQLSKEKYDNLCVLLFIVYDLI